MKVTLKNTSIYPMIVGTSGRFQLLRPKDATSLETDNNGEVAFTLSHYRQDGLNTLLYLLGAIFASEKMRTEVPLDGIYCIRPQADDVAVAISCQEHILDKETSYLAFSFAKGPYEIISEEIHCPDTKKLLKRAKRLYWFGGWMTMLPLSIIAFVVCFISFALSGWLLREIPNVVLFGTIAVVLLFKYFSSIRSLKCALEAQNIKSFLASKQLHNP